MNYEKKVEAKIEKRQKWNVPDQQNETKKQKKCVYPVLSLLVEKFVCLISGVSLSQ